MKALHPPRGFTVVEDELCRASFPLQKENAYFLEQLKLRYSTCTACPMLPML